MSPHLPSVGTRVQQTGPVRQRRALRELPRSVAANPTRVFHASRERSPRGDTRRSRTPGPLSWSAAVERAVFSLVRAGSGWFGHADGGGQRTCAWWWRTKSGWPLVSGPGSKWTTTISTTTPTADGRAATTRHTQDPANQPCRRVLGHGRRTALPTAHPTHQRTDLAISRVRSRLARTLGRPKRSGARPGNASRWGDCPEFG